MKNIQTEIIIKNNTDKVWNVLTDFEKYSVWNPFLIKVSRTPPDHLHIEANLSGHFMKFSAKILSQIPSSELRWIGGIPGIFRGEHYFYLKPISSTKMCLIHGENFRGLLASLSWLFIKRKIHDNFHAMNRALKHRCEN